ncbi:hypothetical protein JB92DRAFT_431030 [Gautieria morchelliformis]|nr:hypothetical protein JB92DRAFT_431030 [Gautieria morchelliformis]
MVSFTVFVLVSQASCSECRQTIIRCDFCNLVPVGGPSKANNGLYHEPIQFTSTAKVLSELLSACLITSCSGVKEGESARLWLF